MWTSKGVQSRELQRYSFNMKCRSPTIFSSSPNCIVKVRFDSIHFSQLAKLELMLLQILSMSAGLYLSAPQPSPARLYLQLHLAYLSSHSQGARVSACPPRGAMCIHTSFSPSTPLPVLKFRFKMGAIRVRAS